MMIMMMVMMVLLEQGTANRWCKDSRVFLRDDNFPELLGELKSQAMDIEAVDAEVKVLLVDVCGVFS